MAFLQNLQAKISRTREQFSGRLVSIFSGSKIDDELYEELEEALIQGDVGFGTACYLVAHLNKRVRDERIADPALLRPALEDEITAILLKNGQSPLTVKEGKLNIWMMVGVNGAGKTTTIGKLAASYHAEGKKVILAAADTFRAAAAEQLAVWAQRAGADLVRQTEGADPGAVVFDACRAAAARHADLLIIDTAGRLQNKSNLMDELRKIEKIIEREAPDAEVEKLLVLDAGTGQNAISQTKIFGETVKLTGIILTKLDGTAKGGVVIGIVNESSLPIRMIGVGEAIEDLREFDPQEFAGALFE